MKLRDYQVELFKEYWENIGKHQRIIIQSPTGTGKSVIMKAIADRYTKRGIRTLILVPSVTLVDNMSKYFGEVATHCYSGVKPDLNKLIIISTYNSAYKLINKIKRLGLIVVDETHHAAAETLIKLLNGKAAKCHILGVTATTRRGDKVGLDLIFNYVARSHPIKWFIEHGYLSDLVIEAPHDAMLGDLTFSSNIFQFANDIKSKLMAIASHEKLVSLWKEKANGKQTIIFNTGIVHSKEVTVRLVA